MDRDALLNAMRRYLDAQVYLDDRHPAAHRRRFEQNAQQARQRLEEILAAAENRQHCVHRPIFQRILVAVDDSSTAHAAIATGAELAAEMSAALAIVHVVDTSGSVATRVLNDCSPLRDSMLRRGQDLLRRLETLVPQGVHREVMLREGTHAEEIIHAANAWRADLIVMGSRGLGRVGRFVMGSTTEAVIQRARQPVLVVSHHAPVSVEPESPAHPGPVAGVG